MGQQALVAPTRNLDKSAGNQAVRENTFNNTRQVTNVMRLLTVLKLTRITKT